MGMFVTELEKKMLVQCIKMHYDINPGYKPSSDSELKLDQIRKS